MIDKEKWTLKARQMMEEVERDDEGIPVTLEGAIRHVILRSPDSFQYRDDALGLLYCVLGSGIGWRNGRLHDRQSNNYLTLPPDKGYGVWSDHGMSESLDSMISDDVEMARRVRVIVEENHYKRLQDAVHVVAEVDCRCQEYRSGSHSWYPISWYGSNLCAPADAQEDFLDGAIETATLIVGTRVQPGTQRWIAHQRTKYYAEQILLALNAIKKTRRVRCSV